MQIRHKISLKHLNTFGLDVVSDAFVSISKPDEFPALCIDILPSYPKHLVLGGGSNMLFTGDYDGLVVAIATKGISAVSDANCVIVKAEAGETWHDLVSYCVERGYGGIENMALIPGSCGAAPVQNIGAYGVELKDVFHSLEAFEIATGKKHVFYPEDCRFGYRDSFFKQEGSRRFIIATLSLRLSKGAALKLSYGNLAGELSDTGISEPGIRDVMEAVVRIRRAKLPDPALTGNAGSFFKNPQVDASKMEQLLKKFPTIVHYPSADGAFKLAAGWLIEQCGWKGYREGDAGVHERQALVLVNHGNASGSDILALAGKITASVEARFGISLEKEVNII